MTMPTRRRSSANRWKLWVLMVCVMLSGCAAPSDSLCVSLTRPPYTDEDVLTVSDGLAEWLLIADTVIEERCP